MTTPKPTMTPEELEQERAELLAALDSPEPLTDDLKRRIAALAAADAARPRTALEEALAEFLGETVALTDRGTLPPGLNTRVAGETVEILSRGDVIATVGRQALADRAAEIEIDRRRD
jgi:predicted transcriptional regulator